MPILVPCIELQPGMRLAEAFYYRDRLMLAADTDLTETDIRLMHSRFPQFSFRIQDSDLDASVMFEDDGYERQVARTAKRRIAECIFAVRERLAGRPTLGEEGVSLIHAAVVDVVKYLQDNPVSAALVENMVSGHGYLSEHAGNVFYLSMLMGTAAHDYVIEERRRLSPSRNLDPRLTESLVPLGLGAITMDLGMMSLQHLYGQNVPLTPELWQQIRDHPLRGAEMLPEDFSPTAKTLVRTHHENMDGTGYPLCISGEKLHVFSRIVRIADAYDAAIATRVYQKEAKTPRRVIWEMTTGPYRHCYDPKLVAVFTRLIHPFPIGAKIRLKSGQYAVVVRYNRTNPMAPLVVIAFDSHDRRLPNEYVSVPIQLGEAPEFRAASFASEDLSYLYEGEPRRTTRSRIGVWPSLFEAAYP